MLYVFVMEEKKLCKKLIRKRNWRSHL